jgi:diguanylate cyclase (GGDEF)-like protein
VASLIRDSVRKEDLVARYAEDEFCVLLIETPLNAAMTVAERIRFELTAQPVAADGQSFSITASIGVCAASRRDDHEPDTVLDRAAAALQEAKAAGKNRVSAHLSPEESDQREEEGFRPPDLGQQSDATPT